MKPYVCRSCRRMHGFTMIELITVMVILGILAVVAIPRLNSANNKALVFRDQTEAALRYAQKSAVSHRRTVCVTFTASSVALKIASTIGATACVSSDPTLPLPGQNTNVVTSADTSNAIYAPVPTNFNFTADGLGTTQTITVSGVTEAINVVGTTGYVGD